MKKKVLAIMLIAMSIMLISACGKKEKLLIHKALFQTVSLYCHMSIPPDTLDHLQYL